MSRALRRDILREIAKSTGRFISLMLIVGIGVGFFVGVKSVSPSMKQTAVNYFSQSRYMDVTLTSPVMGFDADDIEAIAATGGVAEVMPSFMADALYEHDDTSSVVRFMALPRVKSGEPINQITITDGRAPVCPGECILNTVMPLSAPDLKIGDKIKVISGQEDVEIGDMLYSDEFTIVGFFNTPQKVSVVSDSTTLGAGTVDYTAMIIGFEFMLNKPNVAYVRTEKSAAGVSMLSGEYKDDLKRVTDELDALSDERFEINGPEFEARIKEQIDDAKAEYADGLEEYETQKADGRKKLDDARADLIEGQAEYADGLYKYNHDLPAAQRKINDGRKEIEDGRKELEDARDELPAAKSQLDAAQEQLNQKKLEAREQIAALKSEAMSSPEMAQAQSALEQAKAGLAQAQAALDAINAALAQKPEDAELMAQAAAAKEGVAQAQAAVDAIQSRIDQALAPLAEAERQMEEQLAQAQGQLDEKWREYQGGLLEIESNEQKLNEAEDELERAQRELSREKKKAEKDLAQAKKDLNDGWFDLADGEKEFRDEIADAERELADAAQKIRDAEDDLAELRLNPWTVQNRDDFQGYAGYLDDSDRIDAMATVFSVFFFLVAALVSLTTMARMVEEQRGNMGTYKALGYGNAAICAKFLVYSGVAAIIGCVIGILICIHTIPQAVFTAYSILYKMPSFTLVSPVAYSIAASAVAVVAITAVTLITCLGELHSSPAAIMRPKAPKPGKRILLERIRPVWKRLNFISKVTARNLFRYKARFLMTIFGILGCTALLLSAFGLRDSITYIAPKQFDEITYYDGIVMFKSAGPLENKEAVDARIAATPKVTNNMLSSMYSGTIKSDGKSADARVIALADPTRVSDFIALRDRMSKTPVTLDDGGVVVTEKLAQTLGVGVGGAVTITANDVTYQAVVSGITENYLLHYVYMTPAYYEKAAGEAIKYNSEMISIEEPVAQNEHEVAGELLKNSDIVGVSLLSSSMNSFKDQMKGLDLVVVIMILSGGLLAFIVLYNLVNINISERVREIATIKVLGFYNKEVAAYVYRENLILTLLGTAFGLVAGIFLMDYILSTAEMDMFMFPRAISAVSFLVSAGITLAFAALVNFVMYFRLKSVNMVESLKSIE